MSSTPVFKSLTRPMLVAGCERTPAILVSGTAGFLAVLAWFSWSFIVLGFAISIFIVGIATLMMLAKRDPKMFAVAQRYYELQRYYPAKTKANEPKSYTKLKVFVGISVGSIALIIWIML